MSHTQGRWIMSPPDARHGPANDILSLRVAHETGGAIADVYANCLVKTDAECMANARLIAAAPDLLAALIEVTDVLNMALGIQMFGLHPDANGPAAMARDAIAKATGEAA